VAATYFQQQSSRRDLVGGWLAPIFLSLLSMAGTYFPPIFPMAGTYFPVNRGWLTPIFLSFLWQAPIFFSLFSFWKLG
jgi:hypothetical protein